jgi:hypothetical protein
MNPRFALLSATTAALLTAAVVPASGQTAGPANGGVQGATSIPDFSGIWGHSSVPGFEPPASGPGPVVNKSRVSTGPQKGRSRQSQYVGDYTNPILQPWAAEVVRKFGEMSIAGITYENPSNQCRLEPLPYIFWNPGMQMLQQPHQVTILYNEDHEVRHVRMNEPHPTSVKPSWYGDAVGYYEGDALVIDTVGIKTDRPFAMIDLYGTPYTEALHVVERYQLLEYEAAKEGLERDGKENFQIGDAQVRGDPNYRGKHLQLRFTVEDKGAFATAWSATITYRRGVNWRGSAEWPEVVCAENPHYGGKDTAVPRANRPDF